MYERLQKCLTSVRQKTDFVPEIALVLGSGLGNYAAQAEIACTIDYHEIAYFPVSTVAGHAGKFLFGTIQGIPVVIMQGRVHYYEGYSMQEVVLPTRLMAAMGAKTLFLTNASGGINPSFTVGDLMLITDQIASFVPSPLIGPNVEQLGTRFPDMSAIYDKALQEKIEKAAQKLKIPLQKGVYLQTTGPQYESPAEIRMYRALGADAVGMSTACEAIAARHCGMRVCGISCISNMASGMTEKPLSHAEVSAAAKQVSAQFEQLVTESIVQIARNGA